MTECDCPHGCTRETCGAPAPGCASPGREHCLDEQDGMPGCGWLRSVFEACMDAVLLTSPDGSIHKANPAAQKLFGLSEEEICSKGRAGLVDLTDPRLSRLLAEREATGRVLGEMRMRRGDGTVFEAEVSSSVFLNAHGFKRTSMVIRDITDRKQAEQELTRSRQLLKKTLDEKTMLIMEAHCRVKDSLRMLTGLVEQQEEDPGSGLTSEFLSAIRGRISYLSLVHERLYREMTTGPVSIKGYLADLVENAGLAFREGCQMVRTVLDVEDMVLDPDRAILLGLLVNELASNAYRHAFDPDQPGRLSVSLRCPGGACRLTVEDDGRGLPSGFGDDEGFSVGMQLVAALVDQLGGRLEVSGKDGARFEVFFSAR